MASIVPVNTRLTSEVILNTPWPMLGYVHVLHGELHALRARVETLEAKLALDSTNSNRPPSSDSPFIEGKKVKPKRAKVKRKRKGFRQRNRSRGLDKLQLMRMVESWRPLCPSTLDLPLRSS